MATRKKQQTKKASATFTPSQIKWLVAAFTALSILFAWIAYLNYGI